MDPNSYKQMIGLKDGVSWVILKVYLGSTTYKQLHLCHLESTEINFPLGLEFKSHLYPLGWVDLCPMGGLIF